MAIEQFLPYAYYVGENNQDTYSFDFKVASKSDLLIVVLNAAGVEQFRVRGTDIAELSSVSFDPIRGGGEIILADGDLATGYTLWIFNAADEPTQPAKMRDAHDFSLPNFELALDFMMIPVVRLAYLMQRTFKFRDTFDVTGFDMMFPDPTGKEDCILQINEDGDGFSYGPTVSQIASYAQAAQDAQTAAEAAQAAALASQSSATASANSASASASSASDAQAAAEAAQQAAEDAAQEAQDAAADLVTTEHSVTDGQAATDLTDEVFDSADYIAIIFFYTIYRGTTVFSTGMFSMHFRDGAWEIVYPWSDNKADAAADHGVTFSYSGTTVAQLRAALDSGAGNGKILFKRTRFATPA